MNPAISEIKYLGGSSLDFIEVRIPDSYPDPENLVLVIYDLTHNGSITATPSASDMYAIESVGSTANDMVADGVTHYIIGTDYNGTGIALHAQDAVGLYNSVTGETYGLYSFGSSYTVSTAALQPDGITADPFAGDDTTVLPANASMGDSLVLNSGGTYSPTTSPTPGSSFICFCEGTKISTQKGAVRIEDLSIGDMVQCRDSGFKTIRWIGSRWFDLSEEKDHKLKPIKLERGALGPNWPDQDLYLSPNHCVQIEHSICEFYFAEKAMLFPAKHLVGMKGIYISDRLKFWYYHILLDGHELIQSNGIWAESLFLGDATKEIVGRQGREEILSIFPELGSWDFTSMKKLPVGKRFEASIVKSSASDLNIFV